MPAEGLSQVHSHWEWFKDRDAWREREKHERGQEITGSGRSVSSFTVTVKSVYRWETSQTYTDTGQAHTCKLTEHPRAITFSYLVVSDWMEKTVLDTFYQNERVFAGFFLFFCCCCFTCVSRSTRHRKCAGKAGNSRKQQFIKLIRPHQEDVKNIFCKVLINKILDETHFLQSWQWKLISSDSLLSRVCWELHPGVVFSITVDQSWSLLTAVTLESWRGI